MKSLIGLKISKHWWRTLEERISRSCGQIMVENISKDFTNFCAREGIKGEWTTPYNPEQNGVAERKNRTIIEAARAMLYDQDMPKFLWAEACNTTVYIQNIVLHKALGKVTLESVFTGNKPEVSHIRIFCNMVYCSR